MDILQSIAKYLIDPVVARREGSTHRELLRQLEKSQYLSRDELEHLQVQRLRRILLHAQQNCPFYARRFHESGFDPPSVRSLSDMEALPYLTKKDIQENLESLKAQNFGAGDLVMNQTGGSTGSPLRFFLDRQRLFSRKASTIRHNRWAGFDIGDKIAILWGARQDKPSRPTLKTTLKHRLYNRSLFLETSELSKETIGEFLSRLNDFRPRHYLAYARAMFLIARYIKERNLPSYHRPESIITSAEFLPDDQRQLIEEVFGCRVFDRYGSRELSVVASECDRHRGLHIAAETLYVEFRRQDRACKDGELGYIVITDLLNFGMPFIRYKIEDVGFPVGDSCDCGRGLPLMQIEGGRTTDFLVTPEGKVVSGIALALPFVAGIPGVQQLQLVQEERDRLVIRMVKSSAYDDSTLRVLGEKVLEFFGPKMKYNVVFEDHLSAEASGKFRLSICKFDPLEFLT